MDTDTQVEQLKKYNAAYRAGTPMISDAEYDRLVEALREAAPDHPFLHAVEPENLNGKKKVMHPRLMLSTEKAYTLDKIQLWLDRVHKEASQVGVSALTFRVTPKLDGVSGRNENSQFATRGDGRFGQDISDAWDKGVVAIGGKDRGLGEIVIEKKFFENQLADKSTHPRNVVAGLLGADVLGDIAQIALGANAVHFVPYETLFKWEGQGGDLIDQLDRICEDLRENCPYHIDGFVMEVTDETVKQHMGATGHHYRWQIAYKQKSETANAHILDTSWQTGRTGRVTPVLEISPVDLSGATIRRVTAHHAGMVKKLQLGPGAMVQIIRSGEVIPKIESVIEESNTVTTPDRCPACSAALSWDNDFLVCTNPACEAQAQQSIEHWFKTLGNADWFGPKTIHKIIENGVDTLEGIYGLSETDFLKMGFGPGQSKNLADAIVTSHTSQIEDWRFLAAFGIANLGKGDARNLLGHIRMEDLLDTDEHQICQIHGFGEISSKRIADGIGALKPTIEHMLAIGFNLERTPLAGETPDAVGPLTGKAVVFTGKMAGSREQMQQQARDLGATVASSVSGKTDYLVCGENVGAKKIEKAQKLGVAVITENQYLELIGRAL